MKTPRNSELTASRSLPSDPKGIARIYMLVPTETKVVRNATRISKASGAYNESDVNMLYVYEPSGRTAFRTNIHNFSELDALPERYRPDLVDIAEAFSGNGVYSVIALRGPTSKTHAAAVCDRVMKHALSLEVSSSDITIVGDTMIYNAN